MNNAPHPLTNLITFNFDDKIWKFDPKFDMTPVESSKMAFIFMSAFLVGHKDIVNAEIADYIKKNYLERHFTLNG